MLTDATRSTRTARVRSSITTRAGHARELAGGCRAPIGADLVIVWGGDGTVNEAGAALLGTETAIGLVPAGSGNGLAGALATPRDPVDAIARALDGPRRAIDAGTDRRPPVLQHRRHRRRRAHRQAVQRSASRAAADRWPYFAIGVSEGCRYCGQEYEVELDGDTRRLRALLVAFANGSEYGIGARLSAEARPRRRLARRGRGRGSIRARPLLARAAPGVRHCPGARHA